MSRRYVASLRRALAQALPQEFPGLRLVRNNAPEAPLRRSNPAVVDFDEPFAQEIGSGFEQVDAKAVERRMGNRHRLGSWLLTGNHILSTPPM